jgi:hypothetical protein
MIFAIPPIFIIVSALVSALQIRLGINNKQEQKEKRGRQTQQYELQPSRRNVGEREILAGPRPKAHEQDRKKRNQVAPTKTQTSEPMSSLEKLCSPTVSHESMFDELSCLHAHDDEFDYCSRVHPRILKSNILFSVPE